MGHFDSLALLIGVGLDYSLITSESKNESKNPIIIFWRGDGEKEPNDLSGRASLVAKKGKKNWGSVIICCNCFY